MYFNGTFFIFKMCLVIQHQAISFCQLTKDRFLPSNMRSVVVIHLIRRDVHKDLHRTVSVKVSEGLDDGLVSDPCVRGAIVAAI